MAAWRNRTGAPSTVTTRRPSRLAERLAVPERLAQDRVAEDDEEHADDHRCTTTGVVPTRVGRAPSDEQREPKSRPSWTNEVEEPAPSARDATLPVSNSSRTASGVTMPRDRCRASRRDHRTVRDDRRGHRPLHRPQRRRLGPPRRAHRPRPRSGSGRWRRPSSTSWSRSTSGRRPSSPTPARTTTTPGSPRA